MSVALVAGTLDVNIDSCDQATRCEEVARRGVEGEERGREVGGDSVCGGEVANVVLAVDVQVIIHGIGGELETECGYRRAGGCCCGCCCSGCADFIVSEFSSMSHGMAKENSLTSLTLLSWSLEL